MKLHLLSGGAAYGLVSGVQKTFEATHNCQIIGEYGAVGLMKDKLLQGAACDLVILSEKLVHDLANNSHVSAQSVTHLGIVSTGIAVKHDAPAIDAGSIDSFRRVLLEARKIFVPHMAKSTAGQHMKTVFERLGIYPEIAEKCQEHPNGATAMKAMAADPENGLIGCTQETEILYTPGVRLIGGLPSGCELDTVYTAAIPVKAAHPELAKALINTLSNTDIQEFKLKSGFKPLV